MKFTPSEYQEKIFNFITKKSGNAVINAKAGSGKTTTLVESMKLIPSKEKVLFVAFNKAIEEDLQKRLVDYTNVDVRTYHGLGFAILRENYGKKKNFNVTEYKYISYINKTLLINTKNLNGNELRIYKNNLKQLVDFARVNLAQSSAEISQLCKKYGIVPVADECQVVPDILDWGKNNITDIDYTDMVWLCIELDLRTKLFKTDFIFIDEAQDSSILQQALIKKCYKRGTRFIAIGDEYQCINAFAGADQEAFEKFKKEPRTTILELPITYRCPLNIINYVQDVTGVSMLPAPNAIEGKINFDVSPYEPKNNDMVLCRNTAQLVKLYMKYNRLNKKSFLKGRNIAETFKNLIQQTGKQVLASDMLCDGVIPRLYERLFETINKEIELTGLEYEDVINTSRINDLIDSIKALEVLSEGITTTSELVNKIDTIFSDKQEDGICLTTIHKAKGLEADNVFILCSSLMPSKYATEQWEKQSEENLIYVAMTRAKKTLNYISEKQFPPRMFGENENILIDLERQRNKMNRALDINTQILDCAFKTQDERISEDVKTILGTSKLKRKTIDSPKKRNIGGNKFANLFD